LNENPPALATAPTDRSSLDCLSSPHFPSIPDYLHKTYWWAYLHPIGVRLFEREWLVNLILWGNFARLRDEALAELDHPIEQQVLQVACVYGDFTQRIAARLGASGTLNVIDVAPIQLENLRAKLPPHPGLRLQCRDSVNLGHRDGSIDSTLLFFLLHEQPESVRRATLAEALRVTRPGGKIIIIDYHKPHWSNPLRYLMMPILKLLEPFALDLWRNDISAYLPSDLSVSDQRKTTSFGGLYQKLVITL
jgi:ubiquinone/menaquinone biosynthesis C-methylase UbiE